MYRPSSYIIGYRPALRNKALALETAHTALQGHDSVRSVEGFRFGIYWYVHALQMRTRTHGPPWAVSDYTFSIPVVTRLVIVLL